MITLALCLVIALLLARIWHQNKRIRALRESLAQADFERDFFESESFYWYEQTQNLIDWREFTRQ